jgi:hypothetical protein
LICVSRLIPNSSRALRTAAVVSPPASTMRPFFARRSLLPLAAL